MCSLVLLSLSGIHRIYTHILCPHRGSISSTSNGARGSTRPGRIRCHQYCCASHYLSSMRSAGQWLCTGCAVSACLWCRRLQTHGAASVVLWLSTCVDAWASVLLQIWRPIDTVAAHVDQLALILAVSVGLHLLLSFLITPPSITAFIPVHTRTPPVLLQT